MNSELNVFNLFVYYAYLSQPVNIQTFFFGFSLGDHKVSIEKINHRARTITFKVLESIDSIYVKNAAEAKPVTPAYTFLTLCIPKDSELNEDGKGNLVLELDIADEHSIEVRFAAHPNVTQMPLASAA